MMRHPRLTSSLLSALIATGVLSAGSFRAVAHPLGNNSITQFNILYPFKDHVDVEFFIVFAELPTNDILSEIDSNRDGAESPAESKAWVRKTLKGLTDGGLEIIINDRPIPLTLRKQKQDDGELADWYSLSKQPSEIRGLWHLYFMARFKADLPDDLPREVNTIVYRDRSYADTFGVKRVLLDLTDEQKSQVTIVEKSIHSVDEEENPFDYQYYNPLDPLVERDATIRFKINGWKPTPASMPIAASSKSVPLSGLHDSQTEQRFTPPAKTKNKLAQYFSKDRLTFWTVVVGSLFALISGAIHALAPGHAKTAVAAYLISQHGNFRHAVTLAGTVTFTHVFFVILLGFVILFLGSQVGVALQLWLGLTSGVMIAGMGGWLIFRAVTGRIGHHHHDDDPGHGHDHGHDHHHHDDDELPNTFTGWVKRLFSHSHPHLHVEHEHHEHSHEHTHQHEHTHAHQHDHDHAHAHPQAVDYAPSPRPGSEPQSQITAKQIILLGIAGGMVPCPTATLIMLAMITVKRVGLGLYIVGVFSLGLALMLMVVGMLALTSQRFAARILRDETTGKLNPRSNMILTRLLPACSGTVVGLFGAVISAHYGYMLLTNRPLIPWLA